MLLLQGCGTSMKKVKEPNKEELRECPRCCQDYCPDCVIFEEVDFEVFDGSDNLPYNKIQWQGLQVCPWCYNQLIDVNNKK